MNVFAAFLVSVVFGLVVCQNDQADLASTPNPVNSAVDAAFADNGSMVSSGSGIVPTTIPPFTTSKPARTFHAVIGRATSSGTTDKSTASSSAARDPVSPTTTLPADFAQTFGPTVVASSIGNSTQVTSKPTTAPPITSTPTQTSNTKTQDPTNFATPITTPPGAVLETFRPTVVASTNGNSAQIATTTSTPISNTLGPSNTVDPQASAAKGSSSPASTQDRTSFTSQATPPTGALKTSPETIPATVVNGTINPAPLTKIAVGGATQIPSTTSTGSAINLGTDSATVPSAQNLEKATADSSSTSAASTKTKAESTASSTMGNRYSTSGGTLFRDVINNATMSTIASIADLEDAVGSLNDSSLNDSATMQASTSGSFGHSKTGNAKSRNSSEDGAAAGSEDGTAASSSTSDSCAKAVVMPVLSALVAITVL
ncbi:unnamed protein product [Phytophthora fragariaefolia]|uniref:Unnamed protein product n=1 Tax=Phytophthora fragariaefolia TaxID=1490495 RepID=A0A9W6U3Z9_9STRA|nr:unnamed protein product [Phytophthora fragariaefolia]